MTFNYDTSGVKETGDFSPIPKGTYMVRIGKKELKKTAKGYPMVSVTLTVEDGEHAGRKLWNNVVFPPKDQPGAGMAKHWLHAIGQPFEGEVTVDPEEWAGLVKVDVEVGEYNGKPKNEIKNIHIPDENANGSTAEGEDVGF